MALKRFLRATCGVRALRVTPHVARKKRFSAIDGRTTRHAGYAMSLRRRKLIEEGYGWMKDIGGLRKLRHRGKAKVTAIFTFTLIHISEPTRLGMISYAVF